MIGAFTEMKEIIMKKIIGLLCISLLLGSCMNTEDPPGIAEMSSSPAAAENSVVVTEPPTSDQRADSGTAVTTASTTASIDQNEEPSWNLTGEYFGADGSVLEIPPGCDGSLLIQGSSLIRYPTGIYYDTRRTPELFQNGEFIGEEFRDNETEWVSVSVGDKIGDLSVSEAEIVYSYYSGIDRFIWNTIDISFSGETELEGILSSYKSDPMYGDGLYFIPFPDSLAEQSFPMLKGAHGSVWRKCGEYMFGGDTIDLSYLNADEALEIKAEEIFDQYGRYCCKARVKLSNIRLFAWAEAIFHNYCSADLIDFEVIE